MEGSGGFTPHPAMRRTEERDDIKEYVRESGAEGQEGENGLIPRDSPSDDSILTTESEVNTCTLVLIIVSFDVPMPDAKRAEREG
jgi:hypothetical protein